MNNRMSHRIVLTVLFLGTLHYAGADIRTLAIDSVRADTTRTYRYSPATDHAWFTITLSATDHAGRDTIVPTPSVTIRSARPATLSGQVAWLKTYPSLTAPDKQVPGCCTADRVSEPFTLLVDAQRVSFSVRYMDAGCPMEELEGVYRVYCTEAGPVAYANTAPWSPGDTVLFVSLRDTLRVLYNRSSQVPQSVVATLAGSRGRTEAMWTIAGRTVGQATRRAVCGETRPGVYIVTGMHGRGVTAMSSSTLVTP